MEGVLIEYELAEALLEGGQGDEAVRERNSYVPADGRVGKVALQPSNRQLHRKEGQYGVRHSKVALRVLEVNGIDLVWHGR